MRCDVVGLFVNVCQSNATQAFPGTVEFTHGHMDVYVDGAPPRVYNVP